jgi:ribosome-associated toxin RatA of RatAB toxin-antitoxin module
MRSVSLRIPLPSVTPDDAYQILGDFRRYPELTPSVNSVVVEPHPAGGCTSHWEVNFRRGVLRWSERDTFDPDARVLSYEQIDGDFLLFNGEWRVDSDCGAGTVVCFSANFDLGIPSLASILEPVAESALKENISLIVEGLFSTGANQGMGQRKLEPQP